ncbi:FadR/GntR family transcriptional regulator [Phytoactinopolyspora halophila]|nr:FCD domain-containing protein [Phytoactinopolyspora halophila]
MPKGDVGAEKRVIDVVEQEITARNLVPGSKLPTERDLAQLSGEGRTTVRRALESLEAEGRITRHIGRGTFLAPESVDHETVSVNDASPAEIMATRLLLEPQMMPLIVTEGTGSDLTEIERCLHGGNSAESRYEFELWGSAIHRAMAAATHNRMLISICQTFDMHDHPLWHKLLRRNFTAERLALYKQDHQQIVDALLERDGESAQQLMRQHLLHIRNHVLGDHFY